MSPSNDTFRIAIVGGGIAGLATAIALRAENREIIVLEQSSMLKEVGASISLQPNSSGIMERWGFGEDMKRYGGMVDNGFQIFRTDGVRQLQVSSTKATNFGYDRILFHRVDLHDMLKEIATREDPLRGPPATIKLTSRVLGCDCEKGSVQLENGDVLEGFDLIVGADGIHSKIRQSVLGTAVQPKPTGLSAYRMIIPKDNIKDIPHAYAQCTEETWTSMLVGPSCRAVMGPCRAGELLSIVALVPDENMHEQSTDSWTSSGSLEKLLESYAAFPPWTKELFKRAPSWGLWQLRDLDPLPTWVNGRTILIGDASHAMLPTQGQGASQSIEDAEALGAFFSDIKGRPDAATIADILKRVFDVRYERASLIQKYSRQQAKPAANADTLEVTLNPGEFHKYNADYKGAVDWSERVKA